MANKISFIILISFAIKYCWFLNRDKHYTNTNSNLFTAQVNSSNSHMSPSTKLAYFNCTDMKITFDSNDVLKKPSTSRPTEGFLKLQISGSINNHSTQKENTRNIQIQIESFLTSSDTNERVHQDIKNISPFYIDHNYHYPSPLRLSKKPFMCKKKRTILFKLIDETWTFDVDSEISNKVLFSSDMENFYITTPIKIKFSIERFNIFKPNKSEKRRKQIRRQNSGSFIPASKTINLGELGQRVNWIKIIFVRKNENEGIGTNSLKLNTNISKFLQSCFYSDEESEANNFEVLDFNLVSVHDRNKRSFPNLQNLLFSKSEFKNKNDTIIYKNHRFTIKIIEAEASKSLYLISKNDILFIFLTLFVIFSFLIFLLLFTNLISGSLKPEIPLDRRPSLPIKNLNEKIKELNELVNVLNLSSHYSPSHNSINFYPQSENFRGDINAIIKNNIEKRKKTDVDGKNIIKCFELGKAIIESERDTVPNFSCDKRTLVFQIKKMMCFRKMIRNSCIKTLEQEKESKTIRVTISYNEKVEEDFCFFVEEVLSGLLQNADSFLKYSPGVLLVSLKYLLSVINIAEKTKGLKTSIDTGALFSLYENVKSLVNTYSILKDTLIL